MKIDENLARPMVFKELFATPLTHSLTSLVPRVSAYG